MSRGPRALLLSLSALAVIAMPDTASAQRAHARVALTVVPAAPAPVLRTARLATRGDGFTEYRASLRAATATATDGTLAVRVPDAGLAVDVRLLAGDGSNRQGTGSVSTDSNGATPVHYRVSGAREEGAVTVDVIVIHG